MSALLLAAIHPQSIHCQRPCVTLTGDEPERTPEDAYRKQIKRPEQTDLTRRSYRGKKYFLEMPDRRKKALCLFYL